MQGPACSLDFIAKYFLNLFEDSSYQNPGDDCEESEAS
jgi:hypothetical protein